MMAAGANTAEFSVATQPDQNSNLNSPGRLTASIAVSSNTSIFSEVQVFDDDEVPTGISIFEASNSIFEGETAQFYIVATDIQTSNRTIAITVTDGSSSIIDTTSDNYPYEEITIPANSQFVRLRVDTVQQLASISNVTITVTLDASNSGLASSNTSASIMVEDYVEPIISLRAVTSSITKGEMAQFEISSDRPTSNTRTFTAAISATPSNLIDNQSTKTATISPSLTTANFSVSTTNDSNTSYEKNGIITATITLADNMMLEAHVEVIDDDVPTGISILTDSEVINEGETAEFIIMASDATITDRVIGITVADNSANIIDTSAANHPYEEITILQNTRFARLQVSTVEKTASFTSDMITASLNQPPSNSYTLASSNTSASVLVKDQDAQDLSISAITSSVVRGTNARFQISSAFTINSPRLIIARISSNPANLTSGSYTQEVTMNAGSNTTEFSVAVQADPNPARNRPGTITASIPGPNNTEISAVVSTFDETIPTGISIFNIENTIIEGEPAEFFVAASTTVTNDRTIAITVSDGTSNIIDTTSDNHPYDQVIIPGNSHFVRFSVDTVVKPESFSSASITATLDSSNSGLASSNTSVSIYNRSE